MERCSWCLDGGIVQKYHDEEWGQPVYDDHRLFEMLILESFQAGLSWECVLNKREAFRRAFQDFDPERVARYAARMGVRPAGITITGARKRFGSCSGKDRLCFSWRLMQYPQAAIDYVVVHELAHIRHKNHGPGFYAFVQEILPDWRERRALLKE